MGRLAHIKVNDVRLEYAWHGPAPEAAPTLVMLHEGLGCVALWKDFPANLAEATGLGVLVYSRQGYGGSDPVAVPRPLSYMHDEGLLVLPALLDALAVRECLLLGHSDGGSIALINAGGVRDSRVRGLVVMAAHVFNEQICVDSIRAARTAFETTDLRQKLARFHGDNVDCAFWGWNRAWLDSDFWHWNLEVYLPPIRMPVLVIQGRDDEYGTAAQVEAIRRQVSGPADVHILSDCRHSPHRDQPAATLEAVTAFVQRALELNHQRGARARP